MRMVNQGLNLSLNEFILIAEHRNINNYENKSAKDLIKALRESRPRLEIKKNKLQEIEEDFHNLRNAFSKKDVDKYRQLFYDIIYLSELEIEEIRKKFNKLEKSLNFKIPHKNINSIFIMKILIVIKSLMLKILMMMNIEKLEVLEEYLKSLIEIIINQE